MKLQITRKRKDDKRVMLQIAGNMTIYSIKKLKEVLLKELKSSAGMMLDLSKVNEADSSAFQLLVFLKREAESTERSFSVSSMNSRLQAIFSLYNETI